MNDIMRAILLSFFKNESFSVKIAIAVTIIAVILFAGLLLGFFDSSTNSLFQNKTNSFSILSMTDSNGDTWTLEPVRGQPLSIINENDEEPGQPLVLKTNIITVSNSIISIGMILEGKIGEKYIAGALKNREVILTGLAVGIAGYAVGNYLGILIAYLLK